MWPVLFLIVFATLSFVGISGTSTAFEKILFIVLLLIFLGSILGHSGATV